MIYNGCHFVSCSSYNEELFSSQLEINHVLNGTTPKFNTENEDLKWRKNNNCSNFKSEQEFWSVKSKLGDCLKLVWPSQNIWILGMSKCLLSAKIQRNISIFSTSRHFWSRQRCAIHSYIFDSGSLVMKFSPLKFKLHRVLELCDFWDWENWDCEFCTKWIFT